MIKIKDRFPVLAAPLLLLVYITVILVQKRLVTHDATLWISYGQQLFSGGLERFRFNGGAPPFSPLIWTPGYPFFIGLVDLVCGHPVFSAYLVSAVFAVSLAVVVYLAARDIIGRAGARLAFILCGLYPPLFVFATSTVIRPVALFFLYLALYQTFRLIRKGGAGPAALAGIAMGAAILCRFEFALYAVVLGGILLFRVIRRVLRWRPFLWYILSVTAVYAVYAVPLYRVAGYVGLSPYISRLLVKQPLPEKEHVNRANYIKAGLSMRNVLYNGNTASRLNLLNQNTVRVVTSDAAEKQDKKKKSVHFWQRYAVLLKSILPQLVLKLMPLLAVGLYFMVRNGTFRLWSPYMETVVITLVLFPVLGGNAANVRYYSQMYPFLFMLAASGAVGCLKVIKERWTTRGLTAIVIGGLAVLLLSVNLRRVPTVYTPEERAWMDAADFLKRTGNAGDIVFARKRFPAFYAGLRSELLPDEQDLDDVFEYAAYVGAEFLVLDKAITCIAMPQYLPLMGADYPLCLELVHELNPGTDHWCRIFRFK